MKNFIFEHILSTIMELYASPHLPRNGVQVVIDNYDRLLRLVLLPCLKSDLKKTISNNSSLEDKLKELDDTVSKYGSIFCEVDTEDKRFEILKNRGLSDPIPFEFEGTLQENENDVLESKPKQGVYVPLARSLKLFLKNQACLKI